jgi:hypothetical protein
MIGRGIGIDHCQAVGRTCYTLATNFSPAAAEAAIHAKEISPDFGPKDAFGPPLGMTVLQFFSAELQAILTTDVPDVRFRPDSPPVMTPNMPSKLLRTTGCEGSGFPPVKTFGRAKQLTHLLLLSTALRWICRWHRLHRVIRFSSRSAPRRRRD